MTKHLLIALAALAGTLTLQPLARAATTNDPATPATSDRAGAMRERMQETARELSLTPEQTAKLQTIVRERMEKMPPCVRTPAFRPRKGGGNSRRDAKNSSRRSKKVLTPEQFEKWKAKQGLRLAAACGRWHASRKPSRI